MTPHSGVTVTGCPDRCPPSSRPPLRMSQPLSRRSWLRTTSLGVGAGLLAPSALPALTQHSYDDPSALPLLAYAHAVEAKRRAAGAVRLQSNENPYGMSQKARQAMQDGFDDHNKYGSQALLALRNAFAAHAGVPPEYVLVTQGSREVICVTALAFAGRGADVLCADPTFEGLSSYAEHMGATVHRVPLTADHAHDLEAMERRLTNRVGLVFVCNPNNPTGTLVPDNKLRDYVTSTARRTTVLVDEAYHDYVTDPSYRTMTDLVLRGENVVVLRTASKIHGLAGCRIGFAIARPDIIARLQGFTTGAPNALAAHAAIAAIADTEWQQFCVAKNAEGRAIVRDGIAALGRTQSESHTNFVYFHAGRPVGDVQAALAERGYIVGRAFPPYMDWVRVSIGTPDEMRAFVKVLPEALKS